MQNQNFCGSNNRLLLPVTGNLLPCTWKAVGATRIASGISPISYNSGFSLHLKDGKIILPNYQ
jgi:hypothetical protein